MKKKAIVVGAGIGGLATASLLAKDGYAVTVLEKNDRLGGRAMVYTRDGFTFDMGPSWVHMTEVYDTFFRFFGKERSAYVDFIPLDPQYRLYTKPNTYYEISADSRQTLALLEDLEPGAKQRVGEFLEDARRQYNATLSEILYTPFESPRDYLKPQFGRAAKVLRIAESLERHVKRYTAHPDIIKLLSYTILFVGGDPKTVPALYSLLSYMDLVTGVRYPKGGVGALIQAFVKLATEHNVQIIPNQEVIKISVDNGVATGVQTRDTAYSAEVVVVNADYPYAETHLLDPEWQTYPESYWKRKRIAPSAFVMYLGLDRKLPKAAHHMVYIPDGWRSHFDTLFKKPSWPDDPVWYVSCPSVTDQSVAPPGKDQLFITVQVAPGLDDSPHIRQQFAQHIVQKIENTTGLSIRNHILFQKIITQSDYTTLYNAYKGTAVGLATTFIQGFLRPKHRSKKVQNLYYTGQYTLPGVGLAMGVIGAQQTREVIKQHTV